MMYIFVFVVCTCVHVMALPNIYTVLENEVTSYNFPFVNRQGWEARMPTKTIALANPVPFVVIHHSYMPGDCDSRKECCKAMRTMQDMHMDGRAWWDVGYNFGVGGDGSAYEGRGWSTLGAHALHFNSVSIGICLIGDWRYKLPPARQLKTAKSLIAAGVDLGFIRPDYKLVGHRQVRQTECPGDALYQEIKTWDQYSPFPYSFHDLINVKEISDTVKSQIVNNSTKT